ncbi:hypothetical protein BGX29_002819 [Mortierella sp. GBA35]|nr:hypothetical protein BGX29_002819 [Mortierella sp. GBA35]
MQNQPSQQQQQQQRQQLQLLQQQQQQLQQQQQQQLQQQQQQHLQLQQQQQLQLQQQALQQQQQQQQQAQQQAQLGLDWRSTLTNEERLSLIQKLSNSLKALSPTIADAKIVELAKTFENVTYQRSPNKSEYLKAYTRKLQQIRFQITEQQQAAGGSPIVGSPQSQVAMASTPTLIPQVPPNLLSDLSAEQKQSVKEQMSQMMPMFMKLDQLMPFFYALTGNREATARLILMKFMFQDQLDSLKHEQYTITPENLARLKDRLQHYFLWVKSEMASANPNNSTASAPGIITNPTQPTTLGAPPTQLPNAGVLAGMNVSMAATVGNGPGPASTTTFASATPEQPPNPVSATAPALVTAPSASPSAPGPPGMVVKLGLTPADLKLPPPKKSNNSPPSSTYPGSPRSEAGTPSTPNLGLVRPGSVAANNASTPKQGKAVLPVPAAPQAEQQQNPPPAAQDTVSSTISKIADGANISSSQILLKTRHIQQQAQMQQQQQQQQQQQVPQIPQLQQIQQQLHQSVPQLATQPSALQQQTSPLPPSAGSPARPPGTPLESLTKEELIRQYQIFKGALSGAPLPADRVVLVKMQLQRIQAELAKPHRQKQAPRLGDGVLPPSTVPGTPVSAATLTPNSISAANQPLPGAQIPAPTLPADLGPQIRELQMQENKIGSSQPMDPLDFLTFSYKTLARVDDAASIQDESGTMDSSLILRNAFEGFVGKRVGNGPGKDAYDEGPQKRRKLEMKDDDMMDMMLLSNDGHPDAFMASYGDWAQQIPAL